MPENLFLSPSMLAHVHTFTWINDRKHILAPVNASPVNRTNSVLRSSSVQRTSSVQRPSTVHGARLQTEYRTNYLPVYFGKKSKLTNALTPFSGLTCYLPAYKATRVHPVPVLTAKDPTFTDLLTVEAIKPIATTTQQTDPRALLHRLYMRSEYRDNFASASARGQKLRDQQELITRCQSAPGGSRLKHV